MSRTCGSTTATTSPCTTRRARAYPKPVETSAWRSGTPALHRKRDGRRPPGMQPAALAGHRGEYLTVPRDRHDPGHDRAVHLSGDAHRPVRQAVQVVDGAVQRIDDPADPAVAGFAPFLAEDGVAGPLRPDPLRDHHLGCAVHLGDHVGGAGLGAGDLRAALGAGRAAGGQHPGRRMGGRPGQREQGLRVRRACLGAVHDAPLMRPPPGGRGGLPGAGGRQQPAGATARGAQRGRGKLAAPAVR